jgi:hypothetical protein
VEDALDVDVEDPLELVLGNLQRRLEQRWPILKKPTAIQRAKYNI